MNAWLKPSRAISGRHALPPSASVSRITDDASVAAPSRRIDVQSRKQHRTEQPVVKRSRAIEHVPHRSVVRHPEQARDLQIVERGRARHAAGPVENPPGQAVVDPERPALARREIDERKIRRRRSDQRACAADGLGKLLHRVIARQHQMVAVIDRHANGAIEKRTAASAGIGGRLVHDDLRRRPRQLHRRCKSGKTCTDNVNGAGHQMIAY